MSNSDNPTPIIPEGWTASTYLNPSVQSYCDVAHRVKVRLGYPSNNVDVTDEAIANHINEAVELYTRYAGFDEEYVIFCDDALENGCEVKLDNLINSCYSTGDGGVLSSDSSLLHFTYISATNVSSIELGNAQSLLGFETSVSSNETTYLNEATEQIDISNLEITYDSNNPWTFPVCNANRVVINPLSSYPPQEVLSPCLDAWIKVEDGNAEVYPPNWDDLDPCITLEDWWGSTGLSGIENATHINVKGVPTCTVGGTQTLVINTGRGATFRVADKTLNTCGYINAQVEFVNDFDLPDGLSGTFGVISNRGFKLKLESCPDQWKNIAGNVPVDATFYQSLSSFEYGLSSYSEERFMDDDLLTTRRVSDVFFVDPAGNNNGDLLFNFEFAYMQEFFGYDGMGSRIKSRGYDLITYDLSRQMLETVDKYFGGKTIGFQFNKRTQKLRINKTQQEKCNRNSCYLLGVKLERPIAHILPEPWIVDYVTSLTKITMGNTLTKFGGATTLGGLTINGNDVLTQGLEEQKALKEWLINDNSEGGLDNPVYIY